MSRVFEWYLEAVGCGRRCAAWESMDRWEAKVRESGTRGGRS